MLLAAQQGGSGLGWTAPVVLLVYLFVLLAIGYAGYRRSAAGEVDYYLAGRGQGWWVSSLTIMATFFSSFALLGAPGLVYKEGVVFALFALNTPMAGAAVYVLGRRIARLGREQGCVTPADLLANHYRSPVALRLLVALVGLLYTVPYVVMQINAGGIVSHVLFPDQRWSFEIGAVALAVVTVIYIAAGGMRGVAWSDVLQGTLLLGGMLLAGAAAVGALGGVSGFLEGVSRLPAASLRAPGTTGAWTPEKLFTVCAIASVGSMIQPAQWMRYYAARDSDTLRRSAVIFGTVLPVCFLFGVMLVGLGGQALYPLVDEAGEYYRDAAGALLPNPEVGGTPRDFDRILVVVLRDHLPGLLGPLGALLASVILVAIMAASMSTADSNLHALSAVFTRDVYARFLRPGAGEAERTRVGRLAIVCATALALALIFVGRAQPAFNPVALIAQLGLLAIAFSTQLLPVTLDVLFVRRGTRAGAVAGVAAGLGTVLVFAPFLPWFSGVEWVAGLRRLADLGAVGLAVNTAVFVSVSAWQRWRGGLVS